MISLIVAHDRNNVIGLNNEMPWHLPGDLAYFKKVTSGKPVIMGRKTFDSIGRALPNRTNYILTRNEGFESQETIRVSSIEHAIELASKESEEIMIIGGEQLFRAALPLADRLYITHIDASFEGDTFFPTYGEEWSLISESEKQTSDDGIHYSFCVYEKKL